MIIKTQKGLDTAVNKKVEKNVMKTEETLKLEMTTVAAPPKYIVLP